MPEWSIGPHSKCGERATVPRVRIPVFPLGNQGIRLSFGSFFICVPQSFLHGRRGTLKVFYLLLLCDIINDKEMKYPTGIQSLDRIIEEGCRV